MTVNGVGNGGAVEREVSLIGRDLLSVADLSPVELSAVLDRAAAFKERLRRGEVEPRLRGKLVALIFEKPSTRTRVSFEAAVHHLGGKPLVLHAHELQLGRGETVGDTGRVLSRYVHAIALRTFSQSNLVELAEAASVPVINALSDLEHPCQTLADLMTMREVWGDLEGLRVAYLGDGNNVANSLCLGCALVGARLRVGCPPGYEPDASIVEAARELGGRDSVELVHRPEEAVREAQVVYTDVWVSMGQEESGKRKEDLKPFQVNEGLLSLAHPRAVVMHCLPAHRGEEVTDEVLDGPRSVVWDQAENRLHVQAALLEMLLVG